MKNSENKMKMDDVKTSVKKLKKMEPRVRLRIAAAKMELLLEESDAKVNECLKAINEGSELLQKIRAILKAYWAENN